MDEFYDFLGEEPKEETGIQVTDKYKIDTLDALNIVVKERYNPKPTEDNPHPEEKLRAISYHPSIEYAFRSIVDREVNISVRDGIEAVIAKVEELKKFKPKV